MRSARLGTTSAARPLATVGNRPAWLRPRSTSLVAVTVLPHTLSWRPALARHQAGTTMRAGQLKSGPWLPDVLGDGWSSRSEATRLCEVHHKRGTQRSPDRNRPGQHFHQLGVDRSARGGATSAHVDSNTLLDRHHAYGGGACKPVRRIAPLARKHRDRAPRLVPSTEGDAILTRSTTGQPAGAR